MISAVALVGIVVVLVVIIKNNIELLPKLPLLIPNDNTLLFKYSKPSITLPVIFTRDFRS